MGEEDPLLAEVEGAAEKRKAAEDQAFADKLAKRLPPDAVEYRLLLAMSAIEGVGG